LCGVFKGRPPENCMQFVGLTAVAGGLTAVTGDLKAG
jgi:hypothetical protein